MYVEYETEICSCTYEVSDNATLKHYSLMKGMQGLVSDRAQSELLSQMLLVALHKLLSIYQHIFLICEEGVTNAFLRHIVSN